jgi:hypothetical protein
MIYRSNRGQGVSGSLGVRVFIAFVKRALSEKRYRFTNRRKTLDCLTELGWTISDAVDLIFDLTPDDYHEGPLDERDPNFSSGVIYVFKRKVDDITMYIKLKMVDGEPPLVILSFHEDEI